MSQTVALPNVRASGSPTVTAETVAVAVFNTQEQLELILSHLTMGALLFSGNVNKAFRRLIATSPALQRKSFLLPERAQIHKWEAIQNPVNNRVHAVVASPGNDLGADSWLPGAIWEPTVVARLNPLFASQNSRHLSMSSDITWSLNWNSIGIGVLDDDMLDSKAWPHMYLTDPPCMDAHIVVEYADLSLSDCAVIKMRRSVYDAAGITFGSIYNALQTKGPVELYDMWPSPQWLVGGQGAMDDAKLREPVRIIERNRPDIILTATDCAVEFCHLSLPSEAEFEEMGRRGRVEGLQCRSMGPFRKRVP